MALQWSWAIVEMCSFRLSSSKEPERRHGWRRVKRCQNTSAFWIWWPMSGQCLAFLWALWVKSLTYAVFSKLFNHSQAEDVGYLCVHRETGCKNISVLTHTCMQKTQTNWHWHIYELLSHMVVPWLQSRMQWIKTAYLFMYFGPTFDLGHNHSHNASSEGGSERKELLVRGDVLVPWVWVPAFCVTGQNKLLFGDPAPKTWRCEHETSKWAHYSSKFSP